MPATSYLNGINIAFDLLGGEASRSVGVAVTATGESLVIMFDGAAYSMIDVSPAAQGHYLQITSGQVLTAPEVFASVSAAGERSIGGFGNRELSVAVAAQGVAQRMSIPLTETIDVAVAADGEDSTSIDAVSTASTEVIASVNAVGRKIKEATATAQAGTVVYAFAMGEGPAPYQPRTPNVELRVYDESNEQFLGVLTTSYDRTFVERLNNQGVGQFSISIDSPEIGLIQPRRVVRWRIDGRDVHATLIDDRPRVIKDPEMDPAMRVSGPSLAGWLGGSKGGAIIYPEVWRRGLPYIRHLRSEFPDRHFGWASIEYSTAHWTDPDSRGRHGEPLLELPSLQGRPDGWTDGAAEWLWTVPLIDVYGTTDKIGTYRFRRVLSGASGPVEISIAAQNDWRLYIDGDQVGSGRGFNSMQKINVTIPDRKVVCAVEVDNEAGIGLFILSIRARKDGNVGGVLWRTFTRKNFDSWAGTEWKVVGPGDGTPGGGWLHDVNYGDDWWLRPASRGRQDAPEYILPALKGANTDFPDDLAEWLWSRPMERVAGRYSDPPGTSYFRRMLTGYQGAARITIAGTTHWQLYFDGTLVGSGSGFRNTRTFDVNFHGEATVVGVKVDKEDHPDFGRDPGQFILNISSIDEKGERIGNIFRTFTPEVFGRSAEFNWRALDYPKVTPGITPGMLMKTLVDEAQQRGGLEGLTYDFSITHDSNGELWDEKRLINRSFKIGTKLSYVLDQLAETGIDYHITPTGVLRLFKYRGETKNLDVNMPALHSISGTGVQATTLLARTQSGFEQVEEDSQLPRMEDFVEYGDFDDRASVELNATKLLAFIGKERNESDITLSDSSIQPYTDFYVGDELNGGRVTEVAFSQDNTNGAVEWSISLVPAEQFTIN